MPSGGSLERVATEIRHLRAPRSARSRSHSARAEGLEAMPHKRNPSRRSESAAWPASSAAMPRRLREQALWHERDISHSSVERIVLPGATSPSTTCWRSPVLVDRLVVEPERMRENIERGLPVRVDGC